MKVGNKIVKIPAVRFCYLKTSGCSISDSFKNGYCLTRHYTLLSIWHHHERERENERETERQRERETETETERDRETDTDT